MFFQFFGSITNPLDTISPERSYGSVQEGLPLFLGNIFKTMAVAGGLFALFNLVTAGIDYISSQGDPESITKAQSKIYMSLVGMIIIVASYSLAAIIGKILFGDYSAILAPKIYGPGG